MNQEEFIAHIRGGQPVTEAIRKATGHDPYIQAIAATEDGTDYTRYGVMIAGDLLAALVILQLYVPAIPARYLDRIRTGEPCGAVLQGMRRYGSVTPHIGSIQANGRLHWRRKPVGRAQEIFTTGLCDVLS
jgi:hypothetical protein